MKLSERLAQLQQQREACVKKMEAIHQKAMDEGRVFDETEEAGFEEQKAQIGALDKQIKSTEDMICFMEKNAPTVTPGAPTANPRIEIRRNLPKGAAFTRYAMALARSQGNIMQAAEIAKATWSKDTPEVEAVLRAAVAAGTTTDTTWAAPLTYYNDMASEFIELLRPETFMGRISGFKSVPFHIRMGRQTAGATAGWVGQGAPKPVSKLGFDSVTIPHTKMAVIVAITEELARFSTPSAEATVRSDLVEVISQFMDVQFIDPRVAPVADVSPGAVTYGANTILSTGSTVAQITNDLNTALTSMATNNISMRSRYWLLHPRTANFLRTLRTSQDVFAFRDEMSNGRLLGVQFIESNNMPLYDQGSPTASPASLETFIVLLEASEIFLADDNEVMLDVSREASLQMNDTPSAGAQQLVSLWQNNLIGIRAERYAYWARRRPAAVFYIRQVAY